MKLSTFRDVYSCAPRNALQKPGPRPVSTRI